MRNESKSLFTGRSAVAAVVLGTAFVIILWATGRPWICKTGIGLWTGAWSKCTSQQLLDPYSFTHVLHGIIFYWLLRLIAPKLPLHWQMFGAVAIEVAWELVENSQWVIDRYRQQTASLDYVGDSILNSTGDVLATIAGFALATRMSWRAAVVTYFVVEVVLLLTIRDNLTLNVLMLFLPVEAIKQWQIQAMLG